jgi:DNA-binding SARP family transcriptional activator/tetratricopeptide (TPR) repeat protein/DNA-binding transcriptional regulator YiaG
VEWGSSKDDGGAAAAFGTAWLGRRFPPMPLVRTALLGTVGALLLLGIFGGRLTVLVAVIMAAVLGGANVVTEIQCDSALQAQLDDEVLGRAFGLVLSVCMLATIVGTAAAQVLADVLFLPGAFLLLGVLVLAYVPIATFRQPADSPSAAAGEQATQSATRTETAHRHSHSTMSRVRGWYAAQGKATDMGTAAGNARTSSMSRLVRGRRQELGLTQEALASLAGVSVAAVRDLEQGRTRQPRTALVDRLADALSLDRHQLSQQPSAGGGLSGGDQGTGLRLSILGPVTAWRDGQPLALGEPRQRGVLGLLTLNAGSSMHRASLVDAFWGQWPPPTAVNLIQAYVGRLRRVIDPDHSPRDASGLLVSSGTSYRMQVTSDQLDWLAFRDWVSRAAATRHRDATAMCEAYEQALGLWRGDPLADIDALRGHPCIAAAVREWAGAVAGYADAALRAGVPERALPHLRQWVGNDPLNEKAYALLMVALAHTGQQAAALDAFVDVRDKLDAQLGVRPGPELSDAYLRILRRQVAMTSPVTAEAPRVAPRQLPASVRNFVGRAEELDALNDMLGSAQDGDGPVVAVITGTAGVGKTTLALHWAHQVAERFPGGQLYVNLRGFDPSSPPLDPGAAVRGFLEGLGAATDGLPREPHAQAALYRSLLARRRTLVVLDNARDSDQVLPLLPGTAGAVVLITSRSDLTGLVAGQGAQRISLPLLNDADSRHLLAGHLGPDWIARHADTAADLVALCARLPLALSIIGARIAGRQEFSPSSFVEQLRDARGRLDALCVGEASSDLRAVLACSYQHLSPPAAHMFRVLGVHPGPDISAPAAASLAAVPARTAGLLLDELVRAHLVAENVLGRYTCHDLLRAYAVEQAQVQDTQDERDATVDRLLDHYLHTAHAVALLQEPPRQPLPLPGPATGVVPERPADEAQASAWFAAEHAVLMGCVGLADGTQRARHAWQLAWTLVTSFSRRGHWEDLATVQGVALDASRRAGDVTGQAFAHRFLGRARGLLGAHDEAYQHLCEALDLFRRLDDAASQAAVHVGLVREFERRNQHAAALEHAKQALELQRATGYRIGEAIGLNNVGWCYVQLGDHTQALEWCQQALTLQQQIGYRPGEAYTWDTLGYAYHHLNRFAEAVSCYGQALELYRQLDDKYEQAATLARLGDTHADAGEEASARSCWHKALTLMDELHHSDAEDLRRKLQ